MPTISVISIHEEALKLTSSYKKSESDLINIIQKIDALKAFREKGFTSCYDYCVKFLKLSDGASYDFINVARKSKTVPELKAAIDNNLITVSKARRLTAVITKENYEHWIGLAQNLSKEKLEKEIAAINPKTATPEKIKYVTESRLKLELGVSEEFIEMLKKAQDILCQKTKGVASYEMTLEQALKEFLDKHDPVKKAQRALEKIRNTTDVSGFKQHLRETVQKRQENQSTQTLLGPGQVEKETETSNQRNKIGQKNQSTTQNQIPFHRSPLNANLKHQVHLRDQAQCTHVDPPGQRCVQKKWLQIHHQIPIKHGGQNHLQNLKTLCNVHHQMMHT